MALCNQSDGNSRASIFFFFLLLYRRADNEALTRLLQTSLFLVAFPILVKSMFFSFRSSLTLSTQTFLCLPCFSFPPDSLEGTDAVDQRFSTGGRRTTGGTPDVAKWYAKK